MRHDLLALSQDDLASISNRGTVKRASKEIERNKIPLIQISEDTHPLIITWEDATCTFPSERPAQDAQCTCPANNLCRHIIRSILAYQHHHKTQQTPHPTQTQTDTHESPSQDSHIIEGPWDPGSFDDDTLNATMSTLHKKRIEHLIEHEGCVFELTRSKKPVAIMHKLGHTIRFQVPHDLRYTQCDCAAAQPCEHVALAIYAFRKLPKEQSTGFVTLGDRAHVNIPNDTFDQIFSELQTLLSHGLASSPPESMDRLTQLQEELTRTSMIWPASILEELRTQYTHYQTHNAQFLAQSIPELLGELLIRRRALSLPDLSFPQLFLRGSAHQFKSTLGQSRLIGLGCHVEQRGNQTLIHAMMQEHQSGKLMAISHTFIDPKDEPPPSYAKLAEQTTHKTRSQAALGRSQVVLKKAKLHKQNSIELGSSAASLYPQSYDWNTLLPPLHVENFQSLTQHLTSLPPASLRPRILGTDFHTFSIAHVKNVRFDTRQQAVLATLVDDQNNEATLRHTYTHRNSNGTEKLLALLSAHPEQVQYIAGFANLGPLGLTISPTALIFSPPEPNEPRFMLQPWVDTFENDLSSPQNHTLGAPKPPRDPLAIFRSQLLHALAEISLLGFRHLDPSVLERLQNTYTLGLELQLHDILSPLQRLTDSLTLESPSPDTDAYLDTCVLAKLLQEHGNS